MDEALLKVIQNNGVARSDPEEMRRALIRQAEAFGRFQDFQLARLESGEVTEERLLKLFGDKFVERMKERARQQFQAREAPLPNRHIETAGPSYFWPDRPLTRIPDAAPEPTIRPDVRFVPRPSIPVVPKGPIPELPTNRKI